MASTIRGGSLQKNPFVDSLGRLKLTRMGSRLATVGSQYTSGSGASSKWKRSCSVYATKNRSRHRLHGTGPVAQT
jgi:hypothetical protein